MLKHISLIQAKSQVMTSLHESMQSVDNGHLNKYLAKASNVQLIIEQLDSTNNGVVLEEGTENPVMKYISLVLLDLPGPSNANQLGSLGSLAFAETFLESRILSDPSMAVSSEVLCVTSSIPRCHLWSLHDPKTKAHSPVLPEDKWGECLVSQIDVELTPPRIALLPPDKVNLSAWEHGLAFESSQYGTFCLHGNELKGVSLYDGDSMDQVVFLILDVFANEETFKDLPPHLTQWPGQTVQADTIRLVVIFNPHSKAHTNLFGKILPVWKEESEVPAVERLEYLDYNEQEVHSYLQQKLESSVKTSLFSTGPLGSVSLKKLYGVMPNLESFMEHLTSSSGLSKPVTREVFNTLSGCSYEEEHQTDKIIVTILTGTPGSEKSTLCSVLTSYNRHLINWLVYKQPEECSVNSNFLHNSMSDAVRVRDDNSSKATHIVLIAPGFCDTSDVIRVMHSHPNAQVRSQFSIGAVTLCIDPNNTFMEHKMTLPMLTAQCSQGWVNNILFTSQTQMPSQLLDDIQTLIRSINPDVALLKAENGDVKRSTDLDLIMSETAFQDPSKEKARFLMKPYWSLISNRWSCQPLMKDVVVKFSHPLEKHLLLIKLRTIKANLKAHPFEGNIYFVRGFLPFSHSAKVMELEFIPLSGKLLIKETSMVKGGEGGDSNPIYIMSFSGIGLTENALKAFLRTCVKQKPEKKPLITKKDLSEKDIKKIHATHHLEELPDGWFYNGSQFISMSGERSLTHPNLEMFIAAHVAQKNVEIQKYNSRIDNDTYIDLFPTPS